jgi:hypothetical protein
MRLRDGGDLPVLGALRRLVLAAMALFAALATTAAVPPPLARWTFEGDTRDSIGSMHGELIGDASIANGRLVLNGAGYVRTAPLGTDLAAKTLVARVKVDPLDQSGGGVLTLQTTDGVFFDSIVYGERVSRQWMAGSDEFRRTQDLVGAFPEEASAGFVQMAIVYASDGSITAYRNGLPYGEPYVPATGQRTFLAGNAEVLLGMRHTLGANPYFRGEIEDAALYDRALSAAEVAELAGVAPVNENEEVVLEFATSELTIEESKDGTILVRRTGRLDQPVSATLELRAGSAEVSGANQDLFFGAGDGNQIVVEFQPGQTELTVRLAARLDLLAEPPETATLHLLPTGLARVSGAPVTITIIPWISRVRVSGYATEVGPSSISLELETGLVGRVRLQTTAAGTATPGVDFVPVNREVTLIDGSGRRVVSVPITVLRDRRIEGDETIGIQVTALTDYTEVTGGEALLTLLDEPVQVYAEADSTEVTESGGIVRFSLSRIGALESPDVFHVRYRVEGQAREFWEGEDIRLAAEARPGIDFEPVEGLVEFGPGVSRQVVEIPLLNDSELDGPRGLVLRLLGSPEFPNVPSLGQSEAPVVIVDDEHELLRQEIASEALFPETWTGSLMMVDRPGGKALILGPGRALQLTSSGVPDLEFGQRSGWIFGRPEDWNGSLPIPRQTPDGRLVFVFEGESRIRRLLADGTPDLSFGLAEGTLTLTEKIISVVHLFPDGGLALLTESGPEALELIRLRPDGQPDESFQSQRLSTQKWSDYPSATYGPDGSFWIIDADHNLQRLRADGTVDLAFGMHPDVELCFGFDALGRGYCDQDGAGVIRFMPSGEQDTSYLVPFDYYFSYSVVILPEGSTVIAFTSGVNGRSSLSEFDAEGKLRRETPIWQIQGAVQSLQHTADGRFLAVFDNGWDCASAYLDFDGGVTRNSFPAPLVDSTNTWEFAVKSISWGTETYLSRTFRVSTAPQAGIGRTGVFGSGATVRLPFQRTGDTSHPATLAGRIYPLINGREDEGSAVAFEVGFPVNTGSMEAELSLPAASDPEGLRNYLVRVESATGVELSPLNECRLWIFDERTLPPPGELRLVLASGPDTPDTGWLLGWWDPQSAVEFDSNSDLNSNAGWSRSYGASFGGPGLIRVSPISTKESSARFFRLPK